MIRREAYLRCGGFDERIGLDFADFAFNNRLRRSYDSFCVLPMECGHGFSGAEAAGIDAALGRFRLYCEGARNSIRNATDAVLYALVVLMRCLRLTFRFRSLRFFAAYWMYFARGSRIKDRGSGIGDRGELG